MLIVQCGGYFFLNFACDGGKITRSRLVPRLPGNSVCYREVVSSPPMASRFEIVDKEYIEKLKDKGEE